MLTVKGVYENGNIRLTEKLPLPENVSVVVRVETSSPCDALHGIDIPADFFDDLCGVGDGGECDSEHHDQCIYSAP